MTKKIKLILCFALSTGLTIQANSQDEENQRKEKIETLKRFDQINNLKRKVTSNDVIPLIPKINWTCLECKTQEEEDAYNQKKYNQEVNILVTLFNDFKKNPGLKNCYLKVVLKGLNISEEKTIEENLEIFQQLIECENISQEYELMKATEIIKQHRSTITQEQKEKMWKALQRRQNLHEEFLEILKQK